MERTDIIKLDGDLGAKTLSILDDSNAEMVRKFARELFENANGNGIEMKY